MLLPDNIHPEFSVYYNGALVLEALNNQVDVKLIDLFYEVKKMQDISFSLFTLSLDWLYLIEAVQIDEKGIVKKCL